MQGRREQRERGNTAAAANPPAPGDPRARGGRLHRGARGRGASWGRGRRAPGAQVRESPATLKAGIPGAAAGRADGLAPGQEASGLGRDRAARGGRAQAPSQAPGATLLDARKSSYLIPTTLRNGSYSRRKKKSQRGQKCFRGKGKGVSSWGAAVRSTPGLGQPWKGPA